MQQTPHNPLQGTKQCLKTIAEMQGGSSLKPLKTKRLGSNSATASASSRSSFYCNHLPSCGFSETWTKKHASCATTAMLHLSTVEEVKDSDLLALGNTHLETDTPPFVSTEELRDHLIELISVRNLKHRPEALFALFRQFLQRLTLSRLCHFFGPGATAAHPGACPLGGCYSNAMDLSPH